LPATAELIVNERADLSTPRRDARTATAAAPKV
jgi:hypothetical protein